MNKKMITLYLTDPDCINEIYCDDIPEIPDPERSYAANYASINYMKIKLTSDSIHKEWMRALHYLNEFIRFKKNSLQEDDDDTEIKIDNAISHLKMRLQKLDVQKYKISETAEEWRKRGLLYKSHLEIEDIKPRQNRTQSLVNEDIIT